MGCKSGGRGSGVGRAEALAALLLACCGLAWPHPAAADDSAPDAGVEGAAEPDPMAEAEPGSPRASLGAYLDLCREARYDEAGAYLDVPPERERERAVLARRLKAVIDRFVWFDMAEISAASQGDRADGLAATLEQVASIPEQNGRSTPLRMVRRGAGDDARWVFTRETVAHVDDWYGRLDYAWLLDRLPPALLRPGPKELLWWQWIALVPLVALALALGVLLSRLSRAVLSRLAARTKTTWDDAVLKRVSAPLTLGWTIGTIYFLVPWLDLYEPAQEFVHAVLRAVLLAGLFWALGRSVDVGRQLLATTEWAKNHPGSRSIVPLGARVLKVGVLAIAVVALLSELGYPVASLVAGLGIGGLAFALAAQKTVENLFGAFSIGADEPFREGDFVKVEDFVGTVEAIGLRSTRFRTLDRTVVSIPNGKLADMRLETYAARDRIRLACVLGVEYGTTEAQMRQVLEGLEGVLRAHPKIWPDTVVVRFKEFGASSLDIEIMAWFTTSDWGEFQAIRQEILLGFMAVVEKAGTSFAFPTRTVHLAGGGAPPGSAPSP